MAYNKHTWAAREGKGLNKFTDQNGKVYEFTPTPDEVTQPGTPFSAQWMNEMEEQLAKAAVLSGGAVEGNFPVFNALGELINSGKGPDVLQYVNGMFSTLDGKLLDVGNTKIETGSYVGTGTPPTLTFSFTPKVVVIETAGALTRASMSYETAYNNVISVGLERYSYQAVILPNNISFVTGGGSPKIWYEASNGPFGVFAPMPFSYDATVLTGNTLTWVGRSTIGGFSIAISSISKGSVTDSTNPEQLNFYNGCQNGITYNYVALA